MMKKMKRFWALVLSVIVFASTLAGCGQGKKEATKDKNIVKILNNKESLCLAPVHIAIINGYFDEEFAAIGQEYEIVTSNLDTITEQITSGEINAGYGLTGTLMQPMQEQFKRPQLLYRQIHKKQQDSRLLMDTCLQRAMKTL